MNTLATGSNTNGAAAPRPPEMPMKAATRPRDARQARFGQTFSQIVAVLMRDPDFRHLKLADLEWLYKGRCRKCPGRRLQLYFGANICDRPGSAFSHQHKSTGAIDPGYFLNFGYLQG